MKHKLTWYYRWKGGRHDGLAEQISYQLEQVIRSRLKDKPLSQIRGREFDQVLNIGGKVCNLTFWLKDVYPETEQLQLEDAEIEVVWDQDAWAGQGSSSQKSGDENIREYVIQEITYTPTDHNSRWHRLYEWLIGIDKESILTRLLIAFDTRYDRLEWARNLYNRVPRLLSLPQPEIPMFILSGDPGTGKTALAMSIGAPASSKLGESVTLIQLAMTLRGRGIQGVISTIIPKVFEQLASKVSKVRHPCILFFDEADALVPSRYDMDGTSGAQENVAIVNGIIKELDNLREKGSLRVAVIFATNLIQRIDSAIIRRCYFYEFRRPNDKWRWELLNSALRDFDISEEDIRVIFDSTAPVNMNGRIVAYSYSDIVERILLPAIDQSVYENVPLKVETILSFAKVVQPTPLSPDR